MTRLHAEWQRLFVSDTAGATSVRALVLALGPPADWPTLSTVWHAVQNDWGLPAPGIAVDGRGAFQLWFSLTQAVPLAEAHAFLGALCQQHLGEIPPQRLTLWPELDGRHALPDVGTQVQAEQWSAFVSPDLAPVFADTPWLDIPPNPEGQAELLSRLRSITPEAWGVVQARLLAQSQAEAQAHMPSPSPSQAPQATVSTHDHDHDPRRFLLGVMNDASAPLALRIEAAKALLHAPR